MLIGIVSALIAGLGFGVTAAVQKREAVMVSAPLRTLLPTLAKRPPWIAASVGGVVAWVAQVIALARAPIAVVMPFLALGTALLVVLGVRWLGERFVLGELTAVAALTIGAVVTAVSAGADRTSAASLSVWTQVWIVAIGLGVGAVLIGLSSRTAAGIGAASAAGAAFVVTSLLSKEVGDRFVVQGMHALPSLLASPTPWLLAVAGFTGATFEQRGFQRANAATVSAVTTAVDICGTVGFGAFLYREHLPPGLRGAGVVAGLLVTLAGLAQLGRSHRAVRGPGVGPSRDP